MKCTTKNDTEYISLGCRKPRDQMLVEFNQEGFHRRGGTRNGLKDYQYLDIQKGSWEGPVSKKTSRERACMLGDGWLHSGDCEKRREHGKKQRRGEVGQD